MTRSLSLSECLTTQDGRIHLRVPDGVLPQFLIDAFNATIGGDTETARRLSTPVHWALVDRMATEELPGARLASLVLAMVLHRVGQEDAAIRRYRDIAAVDPHPLILNELAEMVRNRGLPTLAAAQRERALAADGNDAAIRANYAIDLIHAGRMTEGLALLRGWVDSGQASDSAHSCLLLYEHYVPGVDRRALFEEHRRWGLRHAPRAWARQHHAHDPDPHRRLRIGYLSADFRSHSVAYNFEAALDARHPEAVEVFGYGSVASPDAVTSRLASKFDVYRPIWGIDDRGVADLIERDRIDILVALAGHTAGHRLRVLAYKPAPIQVDSGGINSTGMEQVDYRLTDCWLDPPEAQPYYLEELVYLPGGYVCYRPPEDLPPAAPLPASDHGTVTFGSCNNHLKANPYVLSLWAQVLRACPGSRLYLRCKAGADEGVRHTLLKGLSQFGVALDRVQIAGWMPGEEHLHAYDHIDVGLDTYPFNGCVTTLEALWMGVPVVTLVGEAYTSRAGGAILDALDLAFLCARSPEQYVAKAAALAGNLRALAGLRGSLRSRMQASRLCDARRYALELETAYRQMWRRWCDRQKPGVKDRKTEERIAADAGSIA
jgi:protein O-GlcNAc transferase